MLFTCAALLVSLASVIATQAEPTCTRSSDCRQLALDAAAREDFETFHSLAWRVVQTGPPNDPDLMFLLARAQALSGRPDDARVMLGRLADRGMLHPEVETHDDFSRVRELAEWPNLLERMHGIRAAASPLTLVPVESPAAVAATPAPPVNTRPAAAVTPAASPPATGRGEVSPTVVPVTRLMPLPPTVGEPVGMAYDRVSARLIIADDASGTLTTVSDLTGNAADLVSRGWGGGYHTNALVIDEKRGDLWVAGTRSGEAPGSVVHRLQLVSGRLLYSAPSLAGTGASRFAAVALSSVGVFILDAEGGRIFELKGADRTLRLRATVPFDGLTGLALAGDTVAYVAHAGGILRIDLATQRSESIKSLPGIALDGIEWIGYFADSLLAVQRRPDGAMAAVRFLFDRRGRTLTAVETFGAAAAKGAVVLGDTFFFVSASPEGTAVARVELVSRPGKK